MSGDPNDNPRDESAETPRPGRKWTIGVAALIVLFVGLGVYDLATDGIASADHTAASPTASKAVSHPTTAGSATPTSSPDSSAAASPAPSASSPTALSAASSVLTIASATAYGPDGPSDGDHPELATGVINGGDGQPWHSSWYDSAEFGNLQSGTGLLLELDATVTVSSVRLTLGSSAGADFEVWVEGMPQLTQQASASASDVSGAVQVRLATPATGRFVLIWFTRLPPSGAGKFQISVYSAAVYGTKGT